MPALGARDEHGLHARREPFESETGRGVEDLLCVFVTGQKPALKEIGPWQNKLGDLAPMRLPEGALGEETRMTSQKFVGGKGHADAT